MFEGAWLGFDGDGQKYLALVSNDLKGPGLVAMRSVRGLMPTPVSPECGKGMSACN